MKLLPETKDSPVLRTDFSNESAWRDVTAAMQARVGEFRAYVELIDDRAYEGVTPEQVPALVPRNWNHTFLFLVDGMTLEHPEHPILVMDLFIEPGRSFRVIPSEMWGVENNLSIANMDFAEFADAVEQDGVFRGFQGE